MKNLFLVIIGSLSLAACATPKPRRYWVMPSEVSSGQTSGRLLTYQVERVNQGVKETIRLPISQVPDAVVVDGNAAGSGSASLVAETPHAPATLADEALLGKKDVRPGLSYLKSIEKIEKLYAGGEYGEALVHLTPLLRHYPKKARLYAMQGTLLEELHENELALDAYRKAQGLEPLNKDYERAVAMLEKRME
jgi:Flp pilus assembly protein TadD